ncbi:MAG: choice-of-anchor L domain-containing protein [Bacteroidota bacterium]
MKNYKIHIILLFAFLCTKNIYSQLNVSTAQTAQQLVQNVLVGQGVTVTNISYTGGTNTIGSFSNGNTTNLGLTSGIVLASGNVNSIGQAGSNSMSSNVGGGSDPQLDAICSASTHDAAILTFDFVPLSDTIKFRYVFGSEEYPVYVCSGYNDVFGFFVTGPNPAGGNYTNKNIALIPGTNLPVAINTVNSGSPGSSYSSSGCQSLAYSSLFTNNSAGATIVFNGFTHVLTAWCKVTPCQTYSIKIAIADAGDHILDSGVFLEANSFTSGAVSVSAGYQNTLIDTIAIENCNNGLVTFKLASPAATNTTVAYTLSGTATNGVDYTAIPTNGVVIPAGQDTYSLNIVPLFDGITEGNETVVLDVQTSPCGTEKYTILIRDNTTLNVNAGTDVTTCTPPVTFNAIASGGITPYQYLWSNSGGASNSATFNPASSTTYTVSVTDHCASTANDAVALNISVGTVEAGNNQTICSGGSATLTASGGSSYVWETGGNTASISVTPTQTTTYTVTSTGGCSAIDSVIVVVTPLPSAEAGNNQTICSGSSATLTASGGGTYHWNTLENTNSISVNPTVNTTYTVTVTNNNCSAEDIVAVNITSLPIAEAGSNQTICYGTSATLTASGGGTYHWSTNANTNSISVNPTTSTSYYVTVTSNNCSAQDVVSVNITPLPVTNAGSDVSICPNGSTTLTATGATSYAWSNSINNATISVSPSVLTSFTVTGTSNSCSSTDQVIVGVYPSNSTVITPTLSNICEGQSIILSATNGASYLWSDSQTGSPITVVPSSNTTYNVTATDANSCTASSSISVSVDSRITVLTSPATICFGNSTQISSSGGTQYSWSPATGLSATNISAPIANPTITTNYSVTVTDGPCSETASVLVTVNPLPNVDAGNDVTICYGNSTNLTASGGSTYVWSTSQNTNPITVSPTSTAAYSVTATLNTCTAQDLVNVYVTQLPTAEAGVNQTICSGSDASLTATGGGSYHWSTNENSNPISVNPTTASTYTVTVTNNNCTAQDFVVVSVNSLPSVEAGSNQTICYGNSATLTVSGGGTYHWSTNETSNSISVSPTSNTTYTVTVTNNNCSAKDSVVVYVTPLPIADAGSNQTICYGSSTILTASGGGTYKWNTNANSSSITVNPTTNTNYTVTVTNNGCTAQDFISVSITPLPIAYAGTDQTICLGSSTTLNATGGGTYQWSTNENTNPIIIHPLSNTTYSVTVTSNNCSAVDFVSVFINPLPTANAGADQTICDGNSALISASGGTIYEWSNGLTGQNISITPPSSTTVTLTVTDVKGCKNTDQITIIVNKLQSEWSDTLNIRCFGESTGYATISVDGGTSPYSYTWGSPISTTANVAYNLSANTIYTVSITDKFGCKTTNQVTLNERPKLNLSFGSFDIRCYGLASGQAIAIPSGGTPNYSYTWMPLGIITATPAINNLPVGSYTLVVKDLYNCSIDTSFTIHQPSEITYNLQTSPTTCFGYSDGEASVIASGGVSPYNYQWSNLQTTTSITNLISDNYTVTITDQNGCDTIVSTHIYQPNAISTNISNDVTICIGSSTTISSNATGGTPPFHYQWSDGTTQISTDPLVVVSPTANTTYSLSVTDNNQCTASIQSIVVSINPPLSIAINPTGPLSICLGDSVSLSVITTGGNGGPYNYSWNQGIGNTNSNSIFVKPITNSVYYVTVTDNCNTPMAIDSITINIFPIPTIDFSGSILEGCQPLVVDYLSQSIDSISTYNWNFWDPNSSDNTSTEKNASHTYLTSGNYSVTLSITDANGCSSSITKTNYITVFPLPIADFTFDPTSGDVDFPLINFYANMDTSIAKYSWNFGDPSSENNDTSSNPITWHKFHDANTYNTCILVTSNKGCKDSICKNIIINDRFGIYIPNAFTPEGDGINDEWYPVATGFDPDSYILKIYNRWGEIIFESYSLENTWNGKFKNKKSTVYTDVFIYVIEINDLKGTTYHYTGNITVVR